MKKKKSNERSEVFDFSEKVSLEEFLRLAEEKERDDLVRLGEDKKRQEGKVWKVDFGGMKAPRLFSFSFNVLNFRVRVFRRLGMNEFSMFRRPESVAMGMWFVQMVVEKTPDWVEMKEEK